MNITLGTAQFGLNYGITNKNGKIHYDEIESILELAWQKGIRCLDTASSYGDSEEIIGQISNHRFKIISKIPPLNNSAPAEIEKHIIKTLKKTKSTKIQSILFHNASDILEHPQGENRLNLTLNLKNQGLINEVGISIYHPKEFHKIVQLFDIDRIQFPSNILDQRFNLKEIFNYGQQIKLDIRSLFLQGLLLINNDELPRFANKYIDAFIKIDKLCNIQQCSRLELCIAYAKSLNNINSTIIGVSCKQELETIINTWNEIHHENINFTPLALHDKKFILPYNWETK